MASESDEEPDVVDSDDAEVEAEADTDAESESPAAISKEEPVELRASESRRKLRDQMQADIERFLKSGGQIEVVDPTVTGKNAAGDGSAEGA
jgi:hypothetical protein